MEISISRQAAQILFSPQKKTYFNFDPDAFKKTEYFLYNMDENREIVKYNKRNHNFDRKRL